MLYGESSGHPGPALVSECLAVAKRDLKAGETLDAIGETCYRGSIDTAAAAARERLLPLGLAKGCVARRDIGKDEVIACDDVEVRQESALLDLRRLQDKVCVDGARGAARREQAVHLLGLDVGTTGVKAVVFDASGATLGSAFRE